MNAARTEHCLKMWAIIILFKQYPPFFLRWPTIHSSLQSVCLEQLPILLILMQQQHAIKTSSETGIILC